MAGEDWYMERSLVFTDNISVMVATADRNHRLNFLTSDLIPRKSEEVRRGFHCSVINDNVQLLQCLRVEYATVAFFSPARIISPTNAFSRFLTDSRQSGMGGFQDDSACSGIFRDPEMGREIDIETNLRRRAGYRTTRQQQGGRRIRDISRNMYQIARPRTIDHGSRTGS